MNRKLKHKIEKKIGRQILKRGDCQYLSDRILDENNNTLSYNTIRRAFNLDSNSNVKASKSTLNILSEFVGYKSYDEYNIQSNWNYLWAYKIKICGLINRMDEDELIYDLNLAYSKNENFSVSFVTVIRELLLLKEIRLLNNIILKSNFVLEDFLKLTSFQKIDFNLVIFIFNFN